MTDPNLYQSDNDGEIDCVNGVILMDEGLKTVVYQSIFGGNEDDDGSDATKAKGFWGNLLEDDEAHMLRSQFQAAIRAVPAVSGNLQIMQDAAENDLAWMIETGLADSISVLVSITGIKRIGLAIDMSANGERYEFAFDESWAETA